MRWTRPALGLFCLLGGCVDVPVPADPPTDSATDGRPADGADARPVDGSPPDGPLDAQQGDTGPDAFADMRPLDAGPLDARPMDAAPRDAGTVDAVPLDAVSPDAEPLDAMPPDALPPDALPPDAGPPTPCIGDDRYFDRLNVCIEFEALPALPNPIEKPQMIALDDGTLLVLEASPVDENQARVFSQTHTLTPGSDVWQTSDGLSEPRRDGTLTFVPGVGAVYAGGESPRGTSGTIEIWDRLTRQWSQEEPGIVPRSRHAAFAADGGLVVVGGAQQDAALLSAEAWPDVDPAPVVPDLPVAVVEASVGSIGDGALLVGGLVDGAPSATTWLLRDDEWAAAQGEVPPAFAQGAGFTTDTDLAVYGGGVPVGEEMPTARIYIWRRARDWSAALSLIRPRSFHSFTSLGNGLVLVFGSSDRVELIEIDRGINDEALIGDDAVAGPRRNHTAVRMDGSVVVAGGRVMGGPISSVWRLTPYIPEQALAEP